MDRWVTPAEFGELGDEALELGFAGVMSGPLVRSSYRAGRLYRAALDQHGSLRGQRPGHDRVSRGGPHARILTCMVKKPGGAAAQAVEQGSEESTS